MFGPTGATACYIIFILSHGLECHPNSIKPVIEATAFGDYDFVVFLHALPFVSLGIPLGLLIFFMPEVLRKEVLSRHYFSMLSASTAVYAIDILQDLLSYWWDMHLHLDRTNRRLKYIVHLLLVPMLYVDTLYTLAIDQRRQALHSAARSNRDRLLVLAENVFMLGYIVLGIIIFWRYSVSTNRMSTSCAVREYRIYLTFQMLVCALVVFVVVRISSHPSAASVPCCRTV